MIINVADDTAKALCDSHHPFIGVGDTGEGGYEVARRPLREDVRLDYRIGARYSNPSFGYGGYCLLKDVRQLVANYQNVPQNLISAIVDVNCIDKDLIAECILRRNPRTVGTYRLVRKEGPDGFRESAVHGVMKRLIAKGLVVLDLSTINMVGPCIYVRPVSGLPLLHAETTPRFSSGQKYFKRTMDLVLSILVIIISPLVATRALAIRLLSEGPMIIRQTRVGPHCEEVTMVKFRSMVVDAEDRLVDLEAQQTQDTGDGVLFR